MMAVRTFSSCTPNEIYDKNTIVPGYNWDYNFKPSFVFDIPDTSKPYRLYINVRHLEAYPYMNLYVWLHILTPEGKVLHRRENVLLAEPSGKWLGEGLNGVWMMHQWCHDLSFGKVAGRYHISIEQDMRVSPLPAVMSVGVRLEPGSPYKVKK